MKKRLNLVDLEKSDVKYVKSLFPDGQQNIVVKNFQLENNIEIVSRLNNWMDLELICAAVACLRNLNVENIHLFTPYISGARSDRRFEYGGNNYLKDVICPIINSLKLSSVTCLDPHSDCLEMGLNNFQKFSNYALVKWALGSNIHNMTLISPDGGALKKIYKLADEFEFRGDVVTCSKSRDENGKLSKIVVPMDSLGPDPKDVVIIDDILDGGFTFISIAQKLRENGFKNKIFLIITHGVFSKPLQEIIVHFDGIFCTNSYKDLKPSENYKAPDFENDFIKQLNIF